MFIMHISAGQKNELIMCSMAFLSSAQSLPGHMLLLGTSTALHSLTEPSPSPTYSTFALDIIKLATTSIKMEALQT